MFTTLSEKISKYRFAHTLPLFLLAAFELWYFLFLNSNIESLINADDASELLLGRLLAEEHAILSRSWFYSTELRFINTNLVYGPLFLLFRNWHTVRILSLIILHLLMIGSFYYFIRQFNRKELFPASALAIMVPLTGTYCWVVVRIPYYIPYIVISFLTLGFLFGYLSAEGRKKRIYLVISAVLSLLACAGGARQAIALYIPLLLTSLFLLYEYRKNPESRDQKRVQDYLVFAGILFAAACLGFLINSTVMQKLYSFRSWSFGFSFFDFNRLKEVTDGLLSSFGYHEGAVTFKRALGNGIAMILFVSTFLSIFYALRNRNRISEQYRFLALFYVSAFIVFALLYSFTTMYYQYRYNIPFFVFSFPLIFLWINESGWFSGIRPLLTAGLVMILCLGALMTYNEERISVIMDDTNEQISAMSEMLRRESYTNGYSSYTCANILTELSNGELDVWFWNDPVLSEMERIDDIYEWLQLKRHKTEIPEGKVFLLLSEDNLENFRFKEKLSEDHLLMKTDELFLWGFASHDEMIQVLEN